MKLESKNILFINILSVLLICNCKKSFLDQKPYTSISASDALKTAPAMQKALTGTYASMRGIYGLAIPALGDLLADNVFVSAANIGRFTGENAYTFTVDGAYSGIVWRGAYTGILGVNNIIDAPLNTGADVQQYKGEAYAIRALLYFDLVRFFGRPYTDDPSSLGVPVVLHYDPKALPKRNTVAEVYNQILADLDKATGMMTRYNGSGTFSKYAAIALSAKVNLYMGNYQLAYDKAKDVIENSGFTLLGSASFTNYWNSVQPNGPDIKEETLLEVVSDAVNNNGADELANAYVQSPNTIGDLLTTHSLYNLYPSSDIRKSMILVGKRSRIGGEDPAYIVNKYPAIFGDFNDKKVIRLSEIYLIAAEAAYRLGQENDADVLLNKLVYQRDKALTYAVTGQQLFEAIILERRKELAFEGERFFDLNRWKLEIPRTPEYPTGVIKAGDFRRVMPIPEEEINVNPNMVQNAGYEH